MEINKQDIEKEREIIKSLQEQLAEKDKENAILKTFIKEKLDCIEIKFYEEDKSIKLDTIIEFLTKREKLKIRHQICEEIREWCQNDWDYDDFMYFLNKLEKGE